MMTKDEALRLWHEPLSELINQAHAVKLRARGDRFSLCTIMNVRSGACSENCAFCAQSARFPTEGPVYPLKSPDEIVEQAGRAKEAGATRFSLVASGRGPLQHEVERFAACVEAVRRNVDIGVCASLGIMDEEALRVLKSAGLSRYHHNLETAASFFPRICTTHRYEDRVATIRAAQAVGLEVCAGGLIGLGESPEERIEMALHLAQLGVDSVPLNILIPIPGTPLEFRPRLAVDEILRTIAVFRMVLPKQPLRIAGGRESALGDFQGLAFWAGADAMLIGGYLTVRGRSIEMDRRLTEDARRLCRGG